MEQSVMFQCHFGVGSDTEYVRGGTVPAGSGSLNCGLVSGLGHAKRGFQLRHGDGGIQGRIVSSATSPKPGPGPSSSTCALSDFDNDSACRNSWQGLLRNAR